MLSSASMHAGPRPYTSGAAARDSGLAMSLGSVERSRVGSAPIHSQQHRLRPSNPPSALRALLSPPRLCMLSKPAALAACLLLTLLWLWLIAHPLLTRSPTVRLVHADALHIDIPDDADGSASAEFELHHPRGGVLVQRADDLEAISRWRSVLHHLHHQEALPSDPAEPSAARRAVPPFSCYGVHAQRGRRRYMEDTHAAYLKHALHYSSAEHAHLRSRDTEEREADVTSPWALFGVFDGHGGALASEYAAAYLLPSVHSALLHHGHTGGITTSLTPLPSAPLHSTATNGGAAAGGAAASGSAPGDGAPPPSLNVSACISDAFQRLDHEFLDLVARPQGAHDGSTALVAGVYYRPDAERRGEAPFQLVVANLGDCRAVYVLPFSNDISLPAASDGTATTASGTGADGLAPSSPVTRGAALALSVDHKPDLDVERSFVESQGGFVTPETRRDVARVQGVLATSRALGDSPLKPMVRSEPDVRIVDLPDVDADAQAVPDDGDEHRCAFESAAPQADATCGVNFGSRPAGGGRKGDGVSGSPLLLLGSDGFWDVFSNEEASQAALDFLHEHTSASGMPLDPDGEPLLSALSRHLVAQAYLRGSFDNITLMAIDVRCVQRWLRKQMNDHALVSLHTDATTTSDAAPAPAPASASAAPRTPLP